MYLAQTINNEDVKSDFYINIFENIVKTHEQSQKDLVDNGILEAISVAKGNKDIFSISNSYYFLVTTLLQKFKSELSKINQTEPIPDEVYPKILHILR